MGILDLPNELVHEIFAYLSDQDVFSGRLVNTTLENASLAHFGKRFFRKKGFMITSPSIDILVQIASNTKLSKYMQHIWFNPDCYTFVTPECAPIDQDSDSESDFDRPGPPRRSANVSSVLDKERQGRYEAYLKCVADHKALLWEDKLRHELARAFQALPNLMTLGMRRSEDYSPYGWSILRDVVGEDPRVLGPIPYRQTKRLSGSTQLLVAVLQALATSGNKIQRLYTDAVEFDNIRDAKLPLNVLDTACKSILYLEINAVKGWVSTKEPLTLKKGDSPDPFVPGSGLVRLFSAAPNLKELGLQIFSGPRQSHIVAPTAKDPESWRQSYPYLVLNNIASNVSFQHLTRVKLEKVPATAEMLQRLFTPCAAVLTSIKLRDIRLLASATADEEASDTEVRPWSEFFSFLVASCPHLSYILFQHLMHARGGISFKPDLPAGDGENENSYLIDHVPQSHGGTGKALFVNFDRLILEVSGRDEVCAKLEEVVKDHWYCQSLFSYAMDEQLW
jgi:hypothetical protein